MSEQSGPSIIDPTESVYYVHLHCLFAIVTAFSSQQAHAIAVAEAGSEYDATQEFTVGVVKPDRHPRVFVSLQLDV